MRSGAEKANQGKEVHKITFYCKGAIQIPGSGDEEDMNRHLKCEENLIEDGKSYGRYLRNADRE